MRQIWQRREDMKNKSRAEPATLLPAVQRHLHAYGIAAGAAGVSVLSITQSSRAEVVYTPANETIGRQSSLRLDLNHDGIIDYTVTEYGGKSGLNTYQYLSVRAARSNSVNCASTYCISGQSYAAALSKGSRIGFSPRRGWMTGDAPMAFEELFERRSVFYLDGWVNVHSRYLGLQFQINGETHFGWARLNVKFHGGLPGGRIWEAQLTGYAYETVARKSIQAGQTRGSSEDGSQASLSPDAPGQLGVLALGSNGIALRRRED
jgi:hypothetical protein